MLFGFNQIGSSAIVKEEKQKQIVIGWQIDTFEGGVGSRKNFLLDVCKEIEKRNNKYVFMINQYTTDEANERLNKGIVPDFISFSSGVNVVGQKLLNTEYYSVGGMVGEKTYAVPWCRGGYVLISKENVFGGNEYKNVIISDGDYTLSKLAFIEEGLTSKKYEYYSPRTAYQKFISTNNVFLGTQRDVIRLENCKENLFYRPLKCFNDLYQYVSVTTESQEKKEVVNDFINTLLSESVQKTLTKIKMFSCVTDLEYDNTVMQEMQNLLDFKTISTFMGGDKYLAIKENLRAINTDKDLEYTKIKNLIVYP